MKLTTAQAANLNRIKGEHVAFGLKATNRETATLIDAKICATTGFARMNRNAMTSLVGKGLAEIVVTDVEYRNDYADFKVQMLVLTDAGRAAIGV